MGTFLGETFICLLIGGAHLSTSPECLLSKYKTQCFGRGKRTCSQRETEGNGKGEHLDVSALSVLTGRAEAASRRCGCLDR